MEEQESIEDINAIMEAMSAPLKETATVKKKPVEGKTGKGVRKTDVALDQNCIQRAERFILQSYLILPKVDCFVLFLKNVASREKIRDYLKNEMSENRHNLEFWIDANSMREKYISNNDVKYLRAEASRIRDKYCNDSTKFAIIMSNLCRNRVMQCLEPGESVDHILSAFKAGQDEILYLLTTTAYSGFLQSKYFTIWRCQERGLASAIALSYVISFTDFYRYDMKSVTLAKDEEKNSVSSSIPKIESKLMRTKKYEGVFVDVNDENVYNSEAIDAYKLMNVNQVHSIINGESQWLIIFLAAIERMPMGITLHSHCASKGEFVARNVDDKYPCIYANQYMETLLGLPRKEILGKSMFLGCHNLEIANRCVCASGKGSDDEKDSAAAIMSASSVKSNNNTASRQPSLSKTWNQILATQATVYYPANKKDTRYFLEHINSGKASVVNTVIINPTKEEIYENALGSHSVSNSHSDVRAFKCETESSIDNTPEKGLFHPSLNPPPGENRTIKDPSVSNATAEDDKSATQESKSRNTICSPGMNTGKQMIMGAKPITAQGKPDALLYHICVSYEVSGADVECFVNVAHWYQAFLCFCVYTFCMIDIYR